MPITKLQPFNLDANANYTFGTVTATNFVGNGSQLTGIVTGTATPTIATIAYPGDDTAADIAGGQTITLTGTNFAAGARVIINGNAVGIVSVVNSTTITFIAPALAAGSYIFYVVNTDGSTAIAVPGLQYSGVPTWTTSAGSLGTTYESVALAINVAAVSNSTVTYSLYSGLLPSGITVNANTGVISGTVPVTSNTTTYTFTIRATDAERQDTDRQFSLIASPDVVTWASPASGSAIQIGINSAYSLTLNAAAASGKTITYTANSLPTGLTIANSAVTGTPTVGGNTTSIITATAATTNRSATSLVNWTIAVSSDPYYNNTYALFNFNGADGSTTYTDSSKNNLTCTSTGSSTPTLATNLAKFGTSSIVFGYRTGNITTPAVAVGTGDYTMEGWVYLTTASTGLYTAIFGMGSSHFRFGDSGFGNRLQIGTNLDSISACWNVPVTTSNFLNTWKHLAFSRQSGVCRVFIDGVQQNLGNGANPGSFPNTSFTSTENLGTVTCNIGMGSSGGYGWIGHMDDVRFTVGLARYTSSFTPPTTQLD